MDRSMSTLLTTLLFSGLMLLTAAQAQPEATPTSLNSGMPNPTFANQVSSFYQDYLAYQGYLKDQGISGYGPLITTIADGTVTVQNVMQAAAKLNQRLKQTLTDRDDRLALGNQRQELTKD